MSVTAPLGPLAQIGRVLLRSARRYPELSEEVRKICRRYGITYNTGPLGKQLWSAAKKIGRLALLPRKAAH